MTQSMPRTSAEPLMDSAEYQILRPDGTLHERSGAAVDDEVLLEGMRWSSFGGATAHGVTLESLAAAGHDTAGLEGHFRSIFSAAVACLALSWSFLLAMEERPLRAAAPSSAEAGVVPVPAE